MTLLRLAHFGLIRRCRNYAYELDPDHPVADEIRALLLRLGGEEPRSAPSASAPKRKPTPEDIEGIGALFGGIETTQVLLQLAFCPKEQMALLRVPSHQLGKALPLLQRMGLIARQRNAQGRILWMLDRGFYAHDQLQAVLQRMRMVLEGHPAE